MPMYDYECDACGGQVQEVRSIANRRDESECLSCGGNMSKVILSAPAIHGNYRTPVVSDSMAVGIDQIAEHKKAFPDVRITDQGQPIMENFTQHEAYLKKSGFIKWPGKIKAATNK